MQVQRPILRYHGGKWQLGPWITSHLPPHHVYVEPFGGAASVLLRKQRSYAEVYNDLDGEVVNLFQVLRTDAQKLADAIELTPFARQEFEDCYKTTKDPIERARRLIVRSFMGFGADSATITKNRTGFRANAFRQGTTPAKDFQNLPPHIITIAERLRGVIIEHRPATKVIENFDRPETLFYCDPPYVHETRSTKMNSGTRQHGYRFELTDSDHRELADTLNQAAGMVVLSGYPCKLYDELFEDWPSVATQAMADGARERTEVLWFNRLAWNKLQSKGPLFEQMSS